MKVLTLVSSLDLIDVDSKLWQTSIWVLCCTWSPDWIHVDLLGDGAHLLCRRIGLTHWSSAFVSFLSEIGISYEWLMMCHCVHRLVKDRDDPLLCNELSGGTSVLLLLRWELWSALCTVMYTDWGRRSNIVVSSWVEPCFLVPKHVAAQMAVTQCKY